MSDKKMKVFCHGKIREVLEVHRFPDGIEVSVPDDDGLPFQTNKFILVDERKTKRGFVDVAK